MIKVNFIIADATIQDYAWSCDNPALADLLNSLLDPLGPSGSDPDPDKTAADQAIDILGGRITDYERQFSKKGQVY